ncbi:MAG: ComEA family DNA-binding protein [Phycisphaerales bacterium]|nr:ComEA family DNA-binding protein [Phycisphaerales bacterium]
MSSSSRQHGWTTRAPKWAAVGVLGVACVGGLAYSMTRDGRVWRATPGERVVIQPAPPAKAATASATHEQPRQSPPTTAVSAAPATGIRTLVNINTATQAELELLPGIGPALAGRIIEHRTLRGAFRRVEDLDAVKGIGPRMLERLRPLVSVE